MSDAAGVNNGQSAAYIIAKLLFDGEREGRRRCLEVMHGSELGVLQYQRWKVRFELGRNVPFNVQQVHNVGVVSQWHVEQSLDLEENISPIRPFTSSEIRYG